MRWGAVIAGMTAVMLVGVVHASGSGIDGAAIAARSMPERHSVVVLKVIDYDAARQSVLGQALPRGAELLDSRTEVNFQGKKHGWIRLRLAADRLPLLLAAVRSAGKLYSERIATTENASQYEELERRVVRLREHQQRLLSVLQSPRRLRGSDILFLQERLFRAGVDEEMLLQQRVDLEREARAGTLLVHLFEPEPRRAMELGNWYAGAALRARTALFRTLARGLTAGAYVLAFAPFWVPALVVALLLARWLRRHRALLGW